MRESFNTKSDVYHKLSDIIFKVIYINDLIEYVHTHQEIWFKCG